ncbi:MAG: GNAT family N-acetyltransferase [Planctomycetota bacterium]
MQPPLRTLRIDRNHELYQQALDLRERILLRSVGLDAARFISEYPGYEERFEHFVSVLDHPTGQRVVGVVCLLPPDSPDEEGLRLGKLMQMAVDEQLQHQGIGRGLVAALEYRTFGELELDGLFCHAQMPAVAFYERLGWSRDGEVFQEAGVDHVRMMFVPSRVGTRPNAT